MKRAFSKEYTSYARAHGRKPQDQLDHDKERWRGGCMCGFILWMSAAIAELRTVRPEAFVGSFIGDHKAKNAFLKTFRAIPDTQ